MKKIIYSLGLSVLLTVPAWAQEHALSEVSDDSSTLSKEDAQTIFFSEDFLNDLTSDDDEVQIFNDIPLDKSSDTKKEKTSVSNTPQKVLAETNFSEAHKKEDNAPLPLQAAPSDEPILPVPVATPKVAASDASKEEPSQIVGKIPQSTPDTISEAVQIQPSVQPKSVKETEVSISEKNEIKASSDETTKVSSQDKVNAVAEAKNSHESSISSEPESSTGQTLDASIKKDDDTQSPVVEEKSAIQETSKEEISETPTTNKPTIQEVIQEKIAPSPIEMPIAPSKPKPNAFSLDDKSPLPKNMLQEEGFSTNMLNRGIRISPEQRARMMMKKKFVEMDTNQDGIITKNEFVRYKMLEAKRISYQVFQQIDTNSDNILSEAEYDVLMDKMIENYITGPKK